MSEGIKSDDLLRLKAGLKDLTDLHNELCNKYSLRLDLIELNDRRYSLQQQLELELKKIEEYQQALSEEVDSAVAIKKKLESDLKLFSDIEKIQEKDDKGSSRYSEILNITNPDNLDELREQVTKIQGVYDDLFSSANGGNSKIDKLNDQIQCYEEFYKRFFEKENDEGENKATEIERMYNSLSNNYDEWFVVEDEGFDNKKEKIDHYIKKAKTFYDDVYGNELKEIPSLKSELENRLDNLDKVEARAKSVIGLSSEAGLAGGFVLKAKDARRGQIISIIIFVSVVVIVFLFNLYLFDKEDFLNINWDTFIFKLLINAPLVWIATIANINLNRFSRLEQEYSHKEALAKSYERYKTEINELEKLGVEGSEDLKVKLLNINLDAFKVNPAVYSDKASSDFPTQDIIQSNKREE